MYIVHIIKYEVHHYCVIISIFLMLAKNGYHRYHVFLTEQNDNTHKLASFTLNIQKYIVSKEIQKNMQTQNKYGNLSYHYKLQWHHTIFIQRQKMVYNL